MGRPQVIAQRGVVSGVQKEVKARCRAKAGSAFPYCGEQNMKIVSLSGHVMLLCVLAGQSFFSTEALSADPPATAPAAAPRRANRAPMTPPEQAQIAKLAELPAWKTGDGDRNYSIGRSYAPAPEMTVKDGVPVGKVELHAQRRRQQVLSAHRQARGTAALTDAGPPSTFPPNTSRENPPHSSFQPTPMARTRDSCPTFSTT